MVFLRIEQKDSFHKFSFEIHDAFQENVSSANKKRVQVHNI